MIDAAQGRGSGGAPRPVPFSHFRSPHSDSARFMPPPPPRTVPANARGPAPRPASAKARSRQLALLAERSRKDRLLHELAYRKRRGLRMCRSLFGDAPAAPPVLVFTTSRSGSTWLCELISRIQRRGHIPEHLRPLHFEYALREDDGREQLARWVQEAATLLRSGRSGGSKLIWDYVPELPCMRAADSGRHMLGPLLALHPVCLRLRRRDIAAQAVSRYWSAATGVYHHRRSQRRALRAASDPVPDPRQGPSFDAGAIRHHEEILQRAEAHLDAFLPALGVPVHAIDYETLLAEPATVMLPIARLLRGDIAEQARQRRVQRALRRALLAKGGGREQLQWLARYRQWRGA